MSVFTELLDVTTCLVVSSSLWIRRRTWRYKWEQPKTIGLLLLTVGTVIKSAPLCWLMDHEVLRGLYLLIAHVFILSGIAAIAYSAERKLRSEVDICRWRVKFIAVPGGVGVMTMVASFIFIRLAEGYTYIDWIIYDALMIYFLGLCAYSLWCLFNDPPSRAGAGIYLFAVGFGLIAVTCRTLLITVTDHVPDMVLINIATASNALALCLFAGGGAWMWKMRLRSINRYGRSKQSVIKDTLDKRD